MSDNWTLQDSESGNERTFENRSAAEDAQEDMQELGVDVELLPPGKTDGGKTTVVEEPAEVEPQADVQLDKKSITDDPMQWLPSHFIDEIQGVPAINRKGYAVLAEHCNISVKAEAITLPSETDLEYAEFQAVATTPDGTEYTGHGSAHVDRDDDPTLLAELAETRAMKRATAWATGVGMTAVEEMEGQE